METTLTSTAGLIPMLLSLIGLLAALQYLKGMDDFEETIRYVFWGFACVFVAKLSVFTSRFMPDGYFYFQTLLFHLCSAVFLTAGGFSIKGVKFFNTTVVISACLLAAVWSWYVVIVTRDANALTFSLAASTAGYGVLAASLWRRKALRNTIGFVITGWFCVFLTLYNLLALMPWGGSLLSPAFETFLYIAIMCGWILISNNMMAHQFGTLEQAAEESKERLRLMIQMSPFPIIISRLKDDQLMLINNKAGALFGLDAKHPGNFKMVDYFAEPSRRTELLAKLEKNPVVDDFEFLVKPRKGDPFWLLLSARVIDFEYEIALYMAFQDITDRKKKEMQLFDQATRDPLTKCYNRRQFEELAKKEIQRSRRYNHPFCLFMIDADHFKNVNDTHGHAVGDLVLQALADCCRRTLRESDIVARFGGEEFVILLPEATIENGFRVAERLRIKISKLVVKNEQDQDVQFTVSIGLVSSTVTDDIPEMLKMADESLYVAKENGRNQVIVYEAGGPNKDLPKPEGEDIEKVKAEPLYYFKPAGNAPVVKNASNEPAETGVVGLSGAAPVEEVEPSLDDDEDIETSPAVEHSHGVSLSSLYDDVEDDAFVPTARPPVAPPPVAEQPAFDAAQGEDLSLMTDPFASPVFADDIPAGNADEEVPTLETPDIETETAETPSEDEFIDDLPAATEIPENSGDKDESVIPPPTPELFEQDNALTEDLTEEEEEGETEFSVPAPEFPEPPAVTDDLDNPPPVPETFATDANETFTPPPLSVPVEPPPPAPVKAPTVKMPVMKKIPIKMPAGMVKIPKMPGVVRVKIPKALHQGDAPVGTPPPQPPHP